MCAGVLTKMSSLSYREGVAPIHYVRGGGICGWGIEGRVESISRSRSDEVRYVRINMTMGLIKTRALQC